MVILYILSDIKFDDFELKSLELNSQMSISDSLTSGFVDMKAGAGSWRDRFFENGTAYATLRNGEVDVENCHFTSGEDYFQASGKYDGIKL